MAPETHAGVQSTELADLLADHWEDTMVRSPEWATQLGDRRFDDKIADPSALAETSRYAAMRAFLLRADALDATVLGPSDARTLRIFQDVLRGDLGEEPCAFGNWNVTPARNAVADTVHLVEDHPLAAEADFGSLARRLDAVPARIDAEMARLRDGLQNGQVAGAEALIRTLSYIDHTLGAAPEDAALFAPGRNPIDAMDDTLRGRLAEAHAAQIRAAVLPKLLEYRQFLEAALLPAARPDGKDTLAGLPNGATCYRGLIRQHTSLDVDAETVHQRGLDEIARVHAAFRTLATKMFADTHPERAAELSVLFDYLRNSPELRFSSAAEVQAEAEARLRAAEAAVPRAFSTLPATPCIVEPIPDHMAPFTYIAWYEPPVREKPGIYRVNTYAPETRLRHEAPVLAFHESVPGHHLQIALAKEQHNIPLFRRHSSVTAFVEGWALYSERLADELGLYPDDLARLGMLSFDAWRSARLVVDTGLHHKGWTREQAERWMLENTPLAENNIKNEVDRYMGWPGQALGYKMGQLELSRLRGQAETELGDRFDIREFHEAVLSGGAVPLSVLEAQVLDYIAQAKASTAQ